MSPNWLITTVSIIDTPKPMVDNNWHNDICMLSNFKLAVRAKIIGLISRCWLIWQSQTADIGRAGNPRCVPGCRLELGWSRAVLVYTASKSLVLASRLYSCSTSLVLATMLGSDGLVLHLIPVCMLWSVDIKCNQWIEN